MRVDYDSGGDLEPGAKDYVGRLASDAGKGDEFFEGLGNFAAKVFYDDARCALNVPCLRAIEASAMDDGFNLWKRRGGECPGCGEGFEKCGGDGVDRDVGGLRGECGGDDELPCGGVREGADGVGVGPLQGFQDGCYSLRCTGLGGSFVFACCGGFCGGNRPRLLCGRRGGVADGF